MKIVTRCHFPRYSILNSICLLTLCSASGCILDFVGTPETSQQAPKKIVQTDSAIDSETPLSSDDDPLLVEQEEKLKRQRIQLEELRRQELERY